MRSSNRENPIIFPPFRLDLADERLYRDGDPIELRPKTFAVLSYLLGRAGQLVTKDELLEAVWPNTAVSDAVLKVCIREIREALADDPASPRFIETAHRRGYRFIGKLSTVAREFEKPALANVIAVGREAEIRVLHDALDKAQTGARQILFVTGEPGIGKTTVVDSFLQSLDDTDHVWYARGQCLEQYGEAEAYLPVLEALGRLCRDPRNQSVVALLRQHAPMWLAQMPALIDAETRAALQLEIQGATRERMLREMAEAIETLTAEHALVFVLEDLHWSDISTLDLITRLARRREPARLMLLGTYRPLELELNEHPLKSLTRELRAHSLCRDLALDSLSDRATADYLSLRFAPNDFPDGLAALIRARTEGNPLFMINVVDYLIADEVIALRDDVWHLQVALDRIETGVPENVRLMIQKQFDRLDGEVQRTLEAASVSGMEFNSTALAAISGAEALKVEERCEDLAQRFYFLKREPEFELPDGSITARYSFAHALYQNVLYQRLGTTRRTRLHQALGEWMEVVYGDRAGEIATELAVHFGHAHDYKRAARYLQQAAENAILRCANHEAVALASRGVELLAKLPASSDRDAQEVKLQITLGIAQIGAFGYATPVAGQTFDRARRLCNQFGDIPELFPVLWGLWVFNVVREDLNSALKCSDELLLHSTQLNNSELLALAHWTKEATLVNLGDFTGAREHFEKVLAYFDPSQTTAAQRYWHDPGVAGRCFGAWALCCLGYPDQALQRIAEAIARAREIRHSHVSSVALFFAAFVHQLRQEPVRALPYAQELVALASKDGLAQWIAFGKTVYGWSLAKGGQPAAGIAEMREGLAACEASNTSISRPHFLGMLAEALVEAGEAQQALATLDESLKISRDASDRYYEAELFRCKGELLWSQSSRDDNAEECFRRAIKIAQDQQSRWFELRAALSLSRMLQDRGDDPRFNEALRPVYDWYTEGFDTPDLLRARKLLSIP